MSTKPPEIIDRTLLDAPPYRRPVDPSVGVEMVIPVDCIAMIRLPVPIPAFASFAKAAEQAAPGCVVTQRGEFLMALKVPQKEGK
jgi:hypothetical protein